MTNPNILASISGKPKSGKTHLALTFPDPICLFSLDIGQDPVLAKFKDKTIEVKEYPIPIMETSKPKGYARDIWNTFKTDYKAAGEGGVFKTLIVDTATILYEIARHAREEELGRPIVPYEYGEVYARMAALTQYPRIAGINVVFTHWLKEEYIKNESTGNMVLDGWRRMIDYVDLVLGTQMVVKTVGGKKENIVVTTIEANRYDKKLNNLELDDTTYSELIALIVGG